VSPQDEIQSTLQATIAELVDAWNTNDMAAFASLFTEDASYVSSVGILLKGRQAIRDELTHGMVNKEGRVVFTNTSIKLIKTDVAVVHNTWKMIEAASTVASRQGVITQLLVNDGERWRIAAMQNTDMKAD
jgi:uncharacterized protein (TIGR02246 family)